MVQPDYRAQCVAFLNDHWKDGLEQEAEMVHAIYSKFVELDAESGKGLTKDAGVRLLEAYERNPKNQKKLKDSQLAKIFKEIVPEDGGKLTASAYLAYRYKRGQGQAAGVAEYSTELTQAMEKVDAALKQVQATRQMIKSIVDTQGEREEYALKPMNCPGHCLMFRQRVRSWRDLPIRYADFGVLHRNELRGALTGLTRVRRFQQDDGHVFCMPTQIRSEMVAALDFMKDTYDTFGFEFRLKLSTRPEKYMGELAMWDAAELQLTDCLNEFQEKTGNKWIVDPGDGAFYGPKIDITVFDALKRAHQCATIQLDFQLPIRFDLEYTDKDQGRPRPVIIHRAILGSVERMMAILTEHYAGNWPFWISPRQIMIVPIAPAYYDYAHEIRRTFHDAHHKIEVDSSKETVNKKIRNAQTSNWNYIFVVGQEEVDGKSVNVRTRDNKVHGVKAIGDVLEHMAMLQKKRLLNDPWDAESGKVKGLSEVKESGEFEETLVTEVAGRRGDQCC